MGVDQPKGMDSWKHYLLQQARDSLTFPVVVTFSTAIPGVQLHDGFVRPLFTTTCSFPASQLILLSYCCSILEWILLKNENIFGFFTCNTPFLFLFCLKPFHILSNLLKNKYVSYQWTKYYLSHLPSFQISALIFWLY